MSETFDAAEILRRLAGVPLAYATDRGADWEQRGRVFADAMPGETWAEAADVVERAALALVQAGEPIRYGDWTLESCTDTNGRILSVWHHGEGVIWPAVTTDGRGAWRAGTPHGAIIASGQCLDGTRPDTLRREAVAAIREWVEAGKP